MTNAAIGFACLFVMTVGPAELQREAPKPSPGSGIIRGRIVGADTQAPVRDVTVSLRPADIAVEYLVRFTGPSGGATGMASGKKDTDPRGAALATLRSTRVDANGNFEFVDIQPGRYRLAVDPGLAAARYLPARHPDPASDDPSPLTVAAGQVVDGIAIGLQRAAAISGRVVDEHGSPVALVSIQAQEVLPGDRRRTAMGFAANLGVRSDDMGSFRLFGLRPGEYILSAQPPRIGALWFEAAVVAGVATTAPPLYFPGTPSSADATRIRVVAGEEHGPVEFTVAPFKLLTVRGLLLDPDGQPVSYVSVMLRREQQTTQQGIQLASSTKPDGTFEIPNVPQGDYTLAAHRFGMGFGSQYARMPIAITDDVAGLTIRLQPGVTVTGTVVVDGPPPSSETMSGLYVRSVPARSIGGTAAGVMPAADRSFTLENQFGPTLIRTEGLPGWHLKTVLYGGRDVTDHPTEFMAEGGSLQVVLTQRAATLSGIVSTSANVPGDATVMVFAEDPALWHDRSTLTRSVAATATGQYRLEGLRAGRYLAVAVTLEDGSTISGAGPAYFELLAKHAALVMLGDGESKTLDLKRVTLK